MQIDRIVLNTLALATALLVAEAHGLRIRVPAFSPEAMAEILACPYFEEKSCERPVIGP